MPSGLSVTAYRDAELPAAISELLTGMDVSENTREQYGRDIRHFLRWLAGRDLYRNVLVDFKGHLKAQKGIAAGTKAKYLTVARAFLKESYRVGLLPVDVTANVRGIRVSRLHKRSPILDLDIKRVFRQLALPGSDARAALIITLMFYQGLRRIEISRLEVEDFDSVNRTLTITGKGRDDSEKVDLHPYVCAALTTYIDGGVKSGPLFPSSHAPTKNLTSNMIYRLVMQVHVEAGVKANPHAWRKAFTTRLIAKSGLSLPEIQTFTRHASLSMLSVYYNRMKREESLPSYYAAFAHT